MVIAKESERSRLERHLTFADKVLKRYLSVGVLFGGVLDEIYSERKRWRIHPDVDILILSLDCKHHPILGEGSSEKHLDWWLRHSLEERPHNDNSQKRLDLLLERTKDPYPVDYLVDDFLWQHRREQNVGLYWSLTLEQEIPPGLYLPSPAIAKETLRHTLQFPISGSIRRKLSKYLEAEYSIHELTVPYTILEDSQVRMNYHTEDNPLAKYCKLD